MPNLRGEVPRHVSIRLRYLDREGVEHEEVRRGLTAGTFQHELDHLDGILFVDRVSDPATLTTWAEFERFHRDAFVERARRLVERVGVVTAYWCELAWLGGDRAEAGVLVEVEDGRIAAVPRQARAAPPGARPRSTGSRCRASRTPTRTPSSARCADARSTAAARSGPGASRCTRWPSGSIPDSYLALARATYAEMALAGITTVGEFHYLHHGPGGAPYGDPNEMGRALIAAAAEAGVRITLIDACYLHGGIGAPPEGAQRRFSDGSAEAWAERVDDLAENEPSASARRSTACARSTPRLRRSWRGGRASAARPLHAHVSEQPAENEACLEAYGQTPTALLDDAGALAANFTAVHATHLDDGDVSLLGGAGACCCVCPTTERDLADGIGRMRRARPTRAHRSRSAATRTR